MKQNIFLMGFMGSGKSFWMNKIAEKLGVKGSDLDTCIERAEGKTIQQIFEIGGASNFRQIEQRTLESILKNEKKQLLALGGGTPCFLDNLEQIKKNGISIYLKIPPAILLKNLKGELEKRPLLKGKSQGELEKWINITLAERSKYYEQADYVVSYDEDNTIMLAQLLQIVQNG